MNEKEVAELAPAVMEVEAEKNILASPEANNDVNEFASRAAAMIALNETAARKDWDQDRVDAAQAAIDAKYESTTPVAAIEAVEPTETIELSKPVEEERTESLVGAIDDARAAHLTEERSHAAAIAAAQQAAKRAELLNIEDTAAHKDWDEDRIEAAKAKVEAKYA